jgi:iron-sulfur cluster assembly protein
MKADCDLQLTEKALSQVKAILNRQKRQDHGLRVSVKSGGCSGYSYHLDFDREARPGDTVLEQGGLKIYVDEESVDYLKGTVIDYTRSLYGGSFHFTNPNATGTCGCGTSFSA